MAASNTNTGSTSSEHLVADTYSLTDAQLADSMEFIEEIGFGNWGSVWSCRSRLGSSRRKIAVKLVHRTTERTTAARVRSIWNEMKIIRTLRDDRHPAIINFHSFIITPSYALVTMEYLPRLVPVEVREPRAKVWFQSLLGGVAHLHARGIVHNDLKPANILLSRTEQPVLVDFGFAERYELLPDAESFVEVASPSKSSPVRKSTSGSKSRRPSVPEESSTSTKPVPFESSLAYGTPEYLSPERARGYKHDTRRSDVWSLGVTFFEIITGRTPFELDDNEEFTSKEDLERYWERSNSGCWVGSWKMTAGLESLLGKMLRPNATERILPKDALLDPYFVTPIIDAEITTVRMTSTGKDIQRIINLGADQAPSMGDASPASPVTLNTRSKLSAIQNLMAKQPQLPDTFPRTPVVQRKPLVPIQKDKDTTRSKPNLRAATPVDKPLLAMVDEKPKSRSFFSAHKRNKSAATSGGATPLTPKAAAPAPLPRAPPPTPCAPAPKRHDPAITPVPVAAAALLQRQVSEKRGVVIIEPQPDPELPVPAKARKARSPSPTASAAGRPTPASTPAAKLRAPVPPRTTNSSKVLTPIRSALRPVPGKENLSNVKVKVRAFESRTAANSSSVSAGAGVKPRVSERTPTKGVLRLKDRNRVQGNVDEKLTPTPMGNKGKQPEHPTDSGGVKASALKGSVLRKTPSTLMKKENIQPQQPSPEDKQASRGRRALHAISRSVDLTRPESPLNHIRHSVRKSIDKTAELFAYKLSSSGPNSIPRKAPRAQKTTAELKELQDSWDDLAKDHTVQDVVQLPTVADTSQEEDTLPAAKKPTQENMLAEETSKKSNRLAMWIQDVEKVASETREELEREASMAMSRRPSSATLLFDTSILSKRSTDPVSSSLPPPRRRGSVSSPPGPSQNHSLQDLLAPGPGTRLSAIEDNCRSERSKTNGASQKAFSVGSIESSEPPTEMPTIPTIAMGDIIDSSSKAVRTNDFYSCEQISRQPNAMLSHPLETSRDSTLDLARLATEVGVNRHPWSTPRASPAPAPRASTPASTSARQPSVQIVTPATPKRPSEFDRVLLSTDNVVRVGNAYESAKSHRGRSPISSSFYHTRQSMENVVSRDSFDVHSEGRASSKNAEPQSGNMRAKMRSSRRSSVIAALRGRQHVENTSTPSALYFAPNEFGAVPSPPPPPHNTHVVYDELGRGTPQQRANTFTNRLKKAFMRVVSTQDMNRAATISVAS